MLAEILLFMRNSITLTAYMPPLSILIDIMVDAVYLDMPVLVETCIETLIKNFHGWVIFAGLNLLRSS